MISMFFPGKDAVVKTFKNSNNVRICPACKAQIEKSKVVGNFYICPECGKHLRVHPRARIGMICDKDSFKEFAGSLRSVDFLDFPNYKEKLAKADELSGENEAVICGEARVGGVRCVIFVMDSRYIMASMGSVVGEKITRAFEYANKYSLPVIGFTASGGARMQEGVISLMQMAKCSAAVKRHGENGNLYVTVLTDPTTGGVTASFAMQGDIILAEPKALVGFAGRRVVEQTTKEALPDNFQTSEFLLEHGFIDAIVERRDQRATISNILKLHKGGATL